MNERRLKAFTHTYTHIQPAPVSSLWPFHAVEAIIPVILQDLARLVCMEDLL